MDFKQNEKLYNVDWTSRQDEASKMNALIHPLSSKHIAVIDKV